MKKYVFIIAAFTAVVFGSCSEKGKDAPKQEVTVEYLKKTTDGKEEGIAKSNTVKVEVGTKVNKEYLKTAKLLAEITGYEFESMDPTEVEIGKEKVTIKLFYKAAVAAKAKVTLEYLSTATGDDKSSELSDKKVIEEEVGKTIDAEYLVNGKHIPVINDYEFDSIDPKEVKLTGDTGIKVFFKKK